MQPLLPLARHNQHSCVSYALVAVSRFSALKEMPLTLAKTFAKALAVVSLLGAIGATAQAQISRPGTSANSVDAEKESSAEQKTSTSMEDEMRSKVAIKAVEKEYQENLERARDLSVLSEAVIISYKIKRQLDRQDIKKLEKAEKLAKGIREAAGGSEDTPKLDKPPQDLASAFTMLGELSESLKVKVEKTPKHVVSAAVIDEANVLLEVIRIIRALSPKP
jgi:hypothetical protein